MTDQEILEKVYGALLRNRENVAPVEEAVQRVLRAAADAACRVYGIGEPLLYVCRHGTGFAIMATTDQEPVVYVALGARGPEMNVGGVFQSVGSEEKFVGLVAESLKGTHGRLAALKSPKVPW